MKKKIAFLVVISAFLMPISSFAIEPNHTIEPELYREMSIEERIAWTNQEEFKSIEMHQGIRPKSATSGWIYTHGEVSTAQIGPDENAPAIGEMYTKAKWEVNDRGQVIDFGVKSFLTEGYGNYVVHNPSDNSYEAYLIMSDNCKMTFISSYADLLVGATDTISHSYNLYGDGRYSIRY